MEIFRANPSIPSFVHQHDGQFCEPEGTFWERMEKLLRDVRYILPAQSAIHLSEQAAKSGLESHFTSRGLGMGLHKGNWNVREILEFQEAVAEGERVPPPGSPAH